ncbi:uncharacterized protein BDV17DRAFT_293348 [Aspergillus undulatus]|uniref:uncharacterized protein n=1 Tax=Aspergillus undulatus TaxID=1810928 RepID=UPI003CCDA743
MTSMEGVGIDNASESTPLLSNHAQNGRVSSRLQRRVTLLLCVFAFTMMLGNNLQPPALTQVTENAICDDYDATHSSPAGVAASTTDPCKAHAVQKELAQVRGYQQLVPVFAALVCTVPYGLLAERIGRKRVLVLSGAGVCAALGWVLAVCFWRFASRRVDGEGTHLDGAAAGCGRALCGHLPADAVHPRNPRLEGRRRSLVRSSSRSRNPDRIATASILRTRQNHLPLLGPHLPRGWTPWARDRRYAILSVALTASGLMVVAAAPGLAVEAAGLLLVACGSCTTGLLMSLLGGAVQPRQVSTVYSAALMLSIVVSSVAGPVANTLLVEGLVLGWMWMGLPFAVAAVVMAGVTVASVAISAEKPENFEDGEDE